MEPRQLCALLVMGGLLRLVGASLLLPGIIQTPLAAPESWDYIVVGSGPSGLVVADRLSETGKKTLLLETGAPSTYASGGREGPDWVTHSHQPLSRFDVPGFFGAFQTYPDGHQCIDVQVPAGCVLGGGTAVNSGIFLMPPDEDWDDNFASGINATDVVQARQRALQRIPGEIAPSRDGKIYFPESFELGSALGRSLGWRESDAIKQPNNKSETFAHIPFMSLNGTRGGPMGSYLLTALARSNFKIQYNSKVQRVLRQGSTVVGVEYVPNHNGTFGDATQVALASGGRVILSAGSFGTPKILFQSGIGPKDQLQIAEDAGELKISQDEWVDLPVGHNLMDQPATYVLLKHPSVGVAYNYTGAYYDPVPQDAEMYLANRTGPLASSNARIAMWLEIPGTDGVKRTVQFNARTGGAKNYTQPDLMVLTAYLTHGMTSRGRLGLNKTTMTIQVIDSPYLNTTEDTAAVTTAINTLLSGVKNVPDLEIVEPQQSTEALGSWVQSQKGVGSNHWLGSSAAGKVVDVPSFEVKGMKGLHVVDAGVFDGMVSSNPVGTLVVMAERAAEEIKSMDS